VVAVPIDYRASADLLRRVAGIVNARVVLLGDEVDAAAAAGLGGEHWRMAELDWRPPSPPPPRAAVTRDDTAEIIFTSGATAEPKGVVITHRNILANVVPVEREIVKYRKYARPFSPIRFLNLLPLSHMFGQSMATFIPPLLAGTVVFIKGYNPHEIVRQVKSRRVSVLVSVPKILDVLREHVLRIAPESADPPPSKEHFTKRWWRYRRAHRAFGLKFWSFVVGAAPLDPALEEFWGRLGFVVIQGYGLTETAPIVSLNHPFSTSRGSVGKAIAGVEVKIAPDGEILVRGENVTRGYFGEAAATAEAFEDGWFHTGDIGDVDATGRLFIKGRKKEMIVTPEGLNVFPEDVERALDALPGVRESAVVGVTEGAQERVHAVLRLDPGTDPEAVVRAANTTLDDHQRVRTVSVWTDGDLPRTEGTRKLKRAAIREWVRSGQRPVAASGGHTVEALIERFSRGRQVSAATTLEELGLSSLERVELMVALEDRFQSRLDESRFAQVSSVADLKSLLEAPATAGEPLDEPVDFPTWNRSYPVWLVRRLSQAIWILPLARVFAHIQVDGREHLRGIRGPVIFAANHQSHMDVPVILAALPGSWRRRVATAMAKEFFKAHFFPEGYTRGKRLARSLEYYMSAAFFNTFPLPQREAGARQTLRYTGDLINEGFSVLIFPEGKRTDHGEIAPFRPGVGMMAARLGVPVVPVRLEGIDRVLHQTWKMAKPGPVRVIFGKPMHLKGDDYVALTAQVESAVRNLEE
jgi:long-chain acyl-CoA synthetase